MLREVEIQDLVLHKNGEFHKVLDVNEQYGWFKTENMFTGKVRTYNMNVTGNLSFTKLSREEVVTFYIQLYQAKKTRGDK
jgi:hypothetical protein